jgi:drug/metabolite transporter (DMT)-like permease
MQFQALPYILSLGLLFGSTLVASRFSVGQFETVTFIAMRMAIAGLLHAIIYLFAIKGRKWPNGRELWKRSVVLGIFSTAIPMNFVTASLNYQSSGVTAILVSLSPVFTVLMAHFMLNDERLNRRKLFGIAVALSGAIFMVSMGETGLPDITQANPIGYLLVISAMISGGFATVYARKYMKGMDAFDVGSVRMWVAGLVTIPLSLLLVGFDLSNVNFQGYASLGWASVAGTFSGMLLSFYIIKRFGATTRAMTNYIIPIVSSVGGMLLLNETITFGMVVGFTLMLTGILVINRWERKPEKSSPIGSVVKAE